MEVQNMSRSMAINQIEQQIEALPPVEQIMMLERIARHLKQLLLAQPIAATPRTECKGIAEKLNQVYQVETSHLDPQLFNAQRTTPSRDEW
jgi:Asp-tRNA(Asn)/Glu-tRNA(Gln) amidotransferase C subunit